jgi:hypothetical protein
MPLREVRGLGGAAPADLSRLVRAARRPAPIGIDRIDLAPALRGRGWSMSGRGSHRCRASGRGDCGRGGAGKGAGALLAPRGRGVGARGGRSGLTGGRGARVYVNASHGGLPRRPGAMARPNPGGGRPV